MGFEDVPLRFLDDVRLTRILAQVLEELGRVSPPEAVPLVVWSVFGEESG
jgi:hypothetical protein